MTTTPDPLMPEFRMESWPFYWITRVSRTYAQEMDNLLKREGVDVARWRVLVILNEIDPSSITQLSDHAIVRMPTMTKLIGRMSAEGLVLASERTSDRRVTEVRLTRKGQKILADARQIANRMFRIAFAEIDEAELAQLNETLRKIYHNLAG